MSGQDRYWVEYYESLSKTGPQWLDYSNERVHLQTFGTVIEIADRLIGRRVLDIGCGRGLLCRMAHVLGAASVTGVDIVEAEMQKLAEANPEITWRAGDVTDATFRSSLGRFDAAYLLEVMQYLPVPQMFDWLWEMLDPGGMIVAVFPFEDCPIVKRTVARFDGRYVPPPMAEIAAWAKRIPDLESWAVRGMHFQEDQRIAPYALTPWTQEATWPVAPNRIQLVIKKGLLAR